MLITHHVLQNALQEAVEVHGPGLFGLVTEDGQVVFEGSGEGVLAFDDSVERWLPGLVPGGGTITVELLVRMHSGLPDYVAALFGDPPDIGGLGALLGAGRTGTGRCGFPRS